MSLIFPPLAANTITAKSPSIFVQEEVLDGVSDRVSERVPELLGMSAGSSVGTRNVVRFFPVTPEKRELALGNHKT
jgi:hypothetical protein